MNDDGNLVSKVLILDSDPACHDRIKTFCGENNLIGLKVQPYNVMSVLKSNVDLGGILLSEHYDGHPQGGIALANSIHCLRAKCLSFCEENPLRRWTIARPQIENL